VVATGDIDVIAPGFAANSLESLEEIAIRYASLYRSHGISRRWRACCAVIFGAGRPVRVSLEGGCRLEFRPLIR